MSRLLVGITPSYYSIAVRLAANPLSLWKNSKIRSRLWSHAVLSTARRAGVTTSRKLVSTGFINNSTRRSQMPIVAPKPNKDKKFDLPPAGVQMLAVLADVIDLGICQTAKGPKPR